MRIKKTTDIVNHQALRRTSPGKHSTDSWFQSDATFNHLYPLAVQLLASRHWTSLGIVRKVLEFLAPGYGSRILDIGSGPGKFCIAAAYYKPSAFFTGVEQRKHLVDTANKTVAKLGLDNIHFIHDNFTRVDFSEYDHFYFYNSFYENLFGTDKIDNSIDYSLELYYYYCYCLNKKLDEKPAGTRLVTFHSLEHEVPDSYQLKGTLFDDALKLWVKW